MESEFLDKIEGDYSLLSSRKCDRIFPRSSTTSLGLPVGTTTAANLIDLVSIFHATASPVRSTLIEEKLTQLERTSVALKVSTENNGW